MQRKRVALVLAFAMVLSVLMPVSSVLAAEPISASQADSRILVSSSPGSLELGRVISDGWIEGGIDFETGYWVNLRAVTAGIEQGYFQYDATHGDVEISGMPFNVTAAYFALNTLAGHVPQATLHFDFFEAPQVEEVWNLTVSFRVDIDDTGETDWISTTFDLRVPPHGGTSVTTDPGLTPNPAPPVPTVVPVAPPSGGGSGGSGGGSGSGSDTGGNSGSNVNGRPVKTGEPSPTSSPNDVSESNETNETDAISEENTSNIIIEELKNAEEGRYQPTVIIPVSGGSANISFNGSDLKALIAADGMLVVEASGFSITFSTEQLEAWELDEDSVVTLKVGAVTVKTNTDESNVPQDSDVEEDIPEVIIPEEDIPEVIVPEEDIPGVIVPEEDIPEVIVPEEDIPEVIVPEEDIPEVIIPEEDTSEEDELMIIDGHLVPIKISSVASNNPFILFEVLAAGDAAINQAMQADRVYVEVDVDGQLVTGAFSATVKIDISGYGLNAEQLSRLTGVSYRNGRISHLGGYVDGRNFVFTVYRPGEYGVMLIEEAPESATDNLDNTSNSNNQGNMPINNMPSQPRTIEMRLVIGNNDISRNGAIRTNDVAAFISENEPMVPIRAVMEGLGAIVDWDDATRTVSITNNYGVQSFSVDAPLPGGLGTPVLRSDRTFVPLAYIQAMGANVTWDSATQTVIITL